MVETPTQIDEQTAGPRPWLRWLFAGLLLFALLPGQIIAGIPLILVEVFRQAGFNPTDAEISFILESMLTSERGLWVALLAAAFACGLTLAAALLWALLFRGRGWRLNEWLAWQAPQGLRLWMVAPLTLAALVAIGFGLTLVFGETEVAIQAALFETPGLKIAAGLIVATIVPLAEELTFRGALYSAALAQSQRRRGDAPAWRQHLLPFLLVTLSFGGAHLLAGFDSLGSIVQVFALSAFITSLRAVSASVTPAVLAHMLWNSSAALMMILAPSLGL